MGRKSYKILSAILLTFLIVQNVSVKSFAEDLAPQNNTPQIENTNDSQGSENNDEKLQQEPVQNVPSQEPVQNTSPQEPASEEPVVITDVQLQEVVEEKEDVTESVNTLEEAVTDVKDLETNEISASGGLPENSETLNETVENIEAINTENIETIKTDIDNVQTNVEEIQKAENEIEKELETATNQTTQLETSANTYESNVQEINDDVDELVSNIENATSVEDVNTLYDTLNEKVETANVSLAQQKEAFEALKSSYDQTIAKLEAAEDTKDEELSKAKENAKDIEDKLSQIDAQIVEAQTSVKESIEVLEEDKEVQSQTQAAIDKSQEKGNMWEKARGKMYAIIQCYYIPQFVDENATDVKIEYTRGFDTQDYNYNKVTYKDAENNTHTFYVNYDMSNKVYNPNDHWANLGDSGKIVMYEKTIDEINANNYLKTYFKGQSINVKNYRNSGKLDVFVYTDANNEKVYMVREEYENKINSGEITQNDEGKYVIDGNVVTEVVQNANSKAQGGAYLLDEENDEMYNNFLTKTSDLYDKFNTYQTKVENAKNLVEDAIEEAGELKETVDTLNANKKNLKVTDVLNSEELANLSNLLTQEQLANLSTMTVKDAVAILNDLVNKATQKVNNAYINYTMAVQKRDEIKDNLDEIIDNLTPDPVIPTPTPTPVIPTPAAPTPDVPVTPNVPVIPNVPSVSAAPTPAATPVVDVQPVVAETPVTETPVVQAANDAVIINDGATPLAAVPQASAVLPQNTDDITATQRNNEDPVIIEDEDTALAAAPTVKNDTPNKSDVVEIEEETTPLASTPIINIAHPNYWWIILLILMITGLINYKIYKKVYEEKK